MANYNPRVCVQFFRFCEKCEDRFKPTSKYNKVCTDCLEKIKRTPKPYINIKTIINNLK